MSEQNAFTTSDMWEMVGHYKKKIDAMIKNASYLIMRYDEDRCLAYSAPKKGSLLGRQPVVYSAWNTYRDVVATKYFDLLVHSRSDWYLLYPKSTARLKPSHKIIVPSYCFSEHGVAFSRRFIALFIEEYELTLYIPSRKFRAGVIVLNKQAWEEYCYEKTMRLVLFSRAALDKLEGK